MKHMSLNLAPETRACSSTSWPSPAGLAVSSHRRSRISWAQQAARVSRIVVIATLLLLAVAPAMAVDFKKGDLEGSWDTTISWGTQFRLEDPDLRLIGLPSGGSAFSVNGDDGNLNYDTGIVSNVVKLTSELELRYKNVGLFTRFRGFYDFENEDEDRLRTPLTDPALKRVGSRADILDAFAWVKFDLGGKPAELRFGEQVLSWGESTFIQGGINVINPIDVSAIRVPGAELRDALLPEGLVSASFGLTQNTSLEAFYLYDWGPTRIDPPGSYWGTNDFAGAGGDVVFLGFGDSADDFNFPDGTNRPFLGVPRDPDQRASESGQYGVALRLFAPNLGGTEFGFYYMNYHSRLPTINGRTGTLAGAIGAGTIAGVAPTIIGTALLTAAQFGPQAGILAGAGAGVQAGLSPTVAGAIAQAAVLGGAAAGASTASAFATDAYAQTAAYFIAYPEDIQLFGLSFNTTVGTWAWQGEVSYKQDVPLQLDDVEILFAALGPINPGLANFNQVANLTGQFETEFSGTRPFDVWQFQTTFTKILSPMMGADSGVLLFEGAVTEVPDLPNKDELRFEGPGTYVSGNPILGPAAHAGKPVEDPSHFADATSWGYRLVGRLDYLNAFGGFNVSPRFAWQQDVDGVSPGPGGNFIEGRTALTLGVGFSRQATWQFDLSYTMFSGAGRYNLINDRDFLGTNVKYSF